MGRLRGQLADQGIDGLELNFFATPRDFETDGAVIEEEQLQAVHDIKRKVSIPVAVKLSVFYSPGIAPGRRWRRRPFRALRPIFKPSRWR